MTHLIAKTLTNGQRVYLTDYPACEHSPITLSAAEAGHHAASVIADLIEFATANYGAGWEAI